MDERILAVQRMQDFIEENLLTSDGTLVTSNMFSFNNDLTWSSEREIFLKQNDLFKYEDWKAFFPEYIFKGFRMEEAKNIYNKGLLDINVYSYMLSNLESEPIKDNNGNNLWMVTTSDDVVVNKEDYLIKEGAYYTLKAPVNKLNFKYWYNTADGKIYQPGDQIRIIYGMHFIAKYE